MKAEINQKLELIEILLYLADRQEKTVQVLENNYYISKINSHFGKHAGHAAVKITQKLIDEQNFIHIKPIKAILLIEEISKDKKHKHFEWANAVNDFISQSRFDEFFASNTDYYNMIIKKTEESDVKKCTDFTSKYFQGKDEPPRLLMCPFAGNYGFLLDNVSFIVRCLPYNENGIITSGEYTNYFIRGIAHEYAHCFVNPVVEKYKEKLNEYKNFFAAHKNMYHCYNVDYAVMNEYFVRAYTHRYFEIFISDFPDFEAYYKRIEETKNAFIYHENFVEMLKEYEKSGLFFEEFYLKNLFRIGEMK